MDTVLTIILWGGLFFLMMRFGCGSHMFGHKHDEKDGASGAHSGGAHSGGGCCKSPKKEKSDVGTDVGTDEVIEHSDVAVITNESVDSVSGETPWAPPVEDTDPICGKKVITAQAKSCERGGLVYYFCSSQCRDEFESSPHE